MVDNTDRANYTPVAKQEQDIFNASFDHKSNMLGVRLVCRAIDGPNSGQLICLNARYNAEIGDYELLTAGSGTTTTTTDTTNTFLLETGSNFLLETGDELLLEA